MENTKVLVVEDNQEDAVLTLCGLKKHSVENKAYVVRDGEEALDFLFCRNKYARRDPHDLPRLTLLDIHLPRMNGLEVLRRIRAEERTRDLPIVLLTSSDNQEYMIEGYQSGANSYLEKPLDSTQFMEAICHISWYWLELNSASPK